MKKSTLKQKRAMKILSENLGKPIGEAMREAGYSKETSETPKNLTGSEAWKNMMEKHFPDDILTKVIEEGLKANRVISAQVIIKSDDPMVKTRQATGRDVDFIDVPDHQTRHKFLETALKLKNKFPAEKTDFTSGGEKLEPLKIIITEDKRPEDDPVKKTISNVSLDEIPVTNSDESKYVEVNI